MTLQSISSTHLAGLGTEQPRHHRDQTSWELWPSLISRFRHIPVRVSTWVARLHLVARTNERAPHLGQLPATLTDQAEPVANL
jgi:hypothetical protein